MVKKKQSEKLSVDQRFFENLMNCLDEEKEICIKQSRLVKKHRVCVEKGIAICADVVNGIYISKTPGRKTGRETDFKYHKQTVKAAEAFLKKFAVKVKVKRQAK